MKAIAMTMKLIVGREYLADPIFCPDSQYMGHVDVNDLPISHDLKEKIQEWNDEYQATFDTDYPPDSAFKSPQLETAHIEKGSELVKRLQMELGDRYIVEYKP